MQLKGTCGTAVRLTEILQDLLNLMRRCRVNQRTQRCTLWAVWVSLESMTPHSGREGGVGGRVEWEGGWSGREGGVGGRVEWEGGWSGREGGMGERVRRKCD